MSMAKERPTHSTMSRSSIRAAGILEALQNNDAEQLNRTLANWTGSEFEPSENSLEGERRELLDGIATQIGSTLASGQDASLYVHLLRHLAAPPETPPIRNCEN